MHPLRVFQDNFASSCRIWTVDGALERQGASASRAFGFSKKYWKLKKLSRKNFCNLFFITRFSKNIFRKTFLWKIKKCDFRKSQNFLILKNFQENSRFFSKNQNFENNWFKCFWKFDFSKKSWNFSWTFSEFKKFQDFRKSYFLIFHKNIFEKYFCEK